MAKIVHVDSKAFPLEVIFKDRYEVDFYQREYVWEQMQIEDLIEYAPAAWETDQISGRVR